jgi:uncharacterized Zn-binding protein involved in type VI secretion
MRAVICKDDPTSHGGKVLEGNARATANGRQTAQKGDMTHCPQCKGDFPIAEGLGHHTFAGVGTAVEGMKTGCGAILIATTTKGFMMVDDQSENKHSAAAVAAASAARAVPPNFGSFRAVDRNTGQPVPGMAYRIELPDGSTLSGATNADGYTERVTGHDPASVRLHWESDTPIEGA